MKINEELLNEIINGNKSVKCCEAQELFELSKDIQSLCIPCFDKCKYTYTLQSVSDEIEKQKSK